MPELNIVIIGNGIAANSAADAARKINKNNKITVISDEDYSLYSPCVLPHYLSGEINKDILFLKNIDDYTRDKINFIPGVKVKKIISENKELQLDNDKILKYDKLIIATGSKPIIPRMKGCNLDGVFTLKSMEDVEKIQNYELNTAAVVGTGLVGIEGAAALREKGYEVHLIELLNRVMPKNFNSPSSDVIEKIIKDNGINVITGERVLEICGDKRVNKIKTDKREIDCDLVIFAVGMKPNIELAEKAGIKIGKLGGIRTNTKMQTNIKDIYACGDCVESPDIIRSNYSLNLLWGFAQKQGETAGSNCSGLEKKYFPDIPSVGTKLFNTAITSIGVTADENDPSYKYIFKNINNRVTLIVLKDNIIVGAQMIGDVDEIGLFTSIIRNRLSLKDVKKNFNQKGKQLINPLYSKLKNVL